MGGGFSANAALPPGPLSKYLRSSDKQKRSFAVCRFFIWLLLCTKRLPKRPTRELPWAAWVGFWRSCYVVLGTKCEQGIKVESFEWIASKWLKLLVLFALLFFFLPPSNRSLVLFAHSFYSLTRSIHSLVWVFCNNSFIAYRNIFSKWSLLHSGKKFN